MKTTKTITLLLALIMTFSLLAACGDKGGEIRDDVLTADIVNDAITAVGGGDNFVDAGADYIKYSLNLAEDSYAECAVRLNSEGIAIDEIGVFKGADAEMTAAIKTAVDNYINARIESWMPEYRPEEFPKLENAEVKVLGNYVMYSIMSDEDKETVFNAFETALEK